MVKETMGSAPSECFARAKHKDQRGQRTSFNGHMSGAYVFECVTCTCTSLTKHGLLWLVSGSGNYLVVLR